MFEESTQKSPKVVRKLGRGATQPSNRRIAEVAWLYYVKGKTQGEIALSLSLSRPTIISYLKQAKERGIVNIKLAPEHYRLNELGEQVAEKYALTSAYVVPSESTSKQQILNDVCEAAAHFLPHWLQPNDQLGVSWGETISIVAEAVPHWQIDGLIVRQLIGSMANSFLNTSESCTTDIARRLSGYCVNINAPAVCTSIELAQALSNEPAIKEQLNSLEKCNKTLFSLSACTLDTHAVRFKVTSKSDIRQYKAKGAVGIIVGRFIDADGNRVLGDYDKRLISATHDTILSSEGLLVVSGSEKCKATHAALLGGYARHVVLDSKMAESLLNSK